MLKTLFAALLLTAAQASFAVGCDTAAKCDNESAREGVTASFKKLVQKCRPARVNVEKTQEILSSLKTVKVFSEDWNRLLDDIEKYKAICGAVPKK